MSEELTYKQLKKLSKKEILQRAGYINIKSFFKIEKDLKKLHKGINKFGSKKYLAKMVASDR